MERTGTYWQNLHAVLITKGFHVFLCNEKFTDNIMMKKIDVKDCQWIQKLHCLGLLNGSFLPDKKTEQLRTYTKYQANTLNSSEATCKKMQKYLRLINFRLDVVVNAICGLKGLLVIRATCQGETNPQKLASIGRKNCRESDQEIARALQSDGRKVFLFALKLELENYNHLLYKIAQCVKMIKQVLNEIIENDDYKKQNHTELKTHKKANKNTPKNIDPNLKSYQMFEGTKLTTIEGMCYSTALCLMSEAGIEGIKKFPSADRFCSWLRLAPNNKISWGRVLSSKIPKRSNRLKIALRNAINAIINLKELTPLWDFFLRINFRKGRASAVSATARKLAAVIWNVVTKSVPYINPKDIFLSIKKRKLGIVKRIQKQIDKFALNDVDLQLVIPDL